MVSGVKNISSIKLENSKAERARLFTLISTAILILYISLLQPAGIDFWLQAKIGEIIVQTGKIPQTLEFPFTEIAVEKFNAHEWLSSIAFHWALKSFGVEGLGPLLSILGLCYFILVARFCYTLSSGNSIISIVGGLLAISTQNYRHVIRPELLAIFLLVFFWMILENLGRRRSRLWELIGLLTVVIWVNSHGSFILAPILAGIYAVSTYLDRLIKQRKFISVEIEDWGAFLFALATLVACNINPFGFDMLLFVFGFGSSPELHSRVTEWYPTFHAAFYKLPTFWVFVSVWIFTSCLMLIKRKRIAMLHWLLYFLFTLLAYRAIRFPIYLGLFSAFIIASTSHRGEYAFANRYRAYMAIAVFSWMSLFLATTFGNLQGLKPDMYGAYKLSDQMVSTLRDERRWGNVLNSMEMGAELIYTSYPRLKPASDCRIDSYGFEYLDYIGKVLLDDVLLKEFVARYDVRYLLMDRKRFDIFIQLGAWNRKEWEVVLIDSRAAFLRRSDIPF